MIQRRFSIAGTDEYILMSLETGLVGSDQHYCDVSIRGSVFSFEERIYGIDSLQALLIALKLAGRIIRESEFANTHEVFWLEPGDDMGIPL